MVTENMKPATRDLLLSMTGVIVLLIVLAATDRRVRDAASDLSPGGVTVALSIGTARLQETAGLVRDLVLDHRTMTAFVAAATVLVACMLRT